MRPRAARGCNPLPADPAVAGARHEARTGRSLHTMPSNASPPRPPKSIRRVTIRFAGDSGDGMQLVGTQFTSTTAMVGNDLATFPDYPAEIRAPAGTLPGVSGFQIQFSSEEVHTPGDTPDVLVTMNPAALKVNVRDLAPNATVIANTDEFNARNLEKAGYKTNPLEDGSLNHLRVVKVDLSKLTLDALADMPELNQKEKKRCKNFLALGLCYWLYQRPLDATREYIRTKFAKRPELVKANLAVLEAGYNFGSNTEIFQDTYTIPPAPASPGTYRNMSGNDALAIGLVAAAVQAGLPLVYGA